MIDWSGALLGWSWIILVSLRIFLRLFLAASLQPLLPFLLMAVNLKPSSPQEALDKGTLCFPTSSFSVWNT